MLKAVALVVSVALLSGCAGLNPYVKNYVQVNDRETLPVEQSLPVSPLLKQGVDPLSDLEDMLADGYDLLGYSAFSADLSSSDKAIQQASLVGADVVVYYPPVFQRTATTVIPFQLPTTTTSYSNATATAYNSYGASATAYASGVTKTYGQQWTAIPIQRDTYFQSASYYVKTKRLVGLIFRSPTPQEVAALGTQRLAVVTTVVRGSGAYRADILPGDIIVRADGLTVDQIPDAEAFARARLGRTLTLDIVRAGRLIKKDLEIR